MDEAASIVIEPFNDHYVLVYADRKIFGGEIEARGGKWNKTHKGWLLPKDQKTQVVILGNIEKNNNIFEQTMSSFAKKSTQKKFHRAISDDETSSPESPVESRRRRKFNRSRNRKKKTNKNEKKTPPIYVPVSTLLNDSSSDSEHESSDDSDFPEVSSPRDHEKEYKAFLRKQRKLKNKN
tara:strand:- start:176 stop:715 length:540 start_codon:yes stop_codon:yes gene_type:complete